MAKTYKIAVIPGDGIGKEVTPWAQKALEKAAEGVADFEYENFDLGAERYLRDGAILPEDEEERIKANDAILLGAVGDPRIKAGILERGLLLKLRFDLDQYVTLRPAKLYKGDTSPLAYIIPGIFTELSAATGFYFWKAKAENEIKLDTIRRQKELEQSKKQNTEPGEYDPGSNYEGGTP